MNFIIARLLNVGIVLLILFGLDWSVLQQKGHTNQAVLPLTEMEQQYLSDWVRLFEFIPKIKVCAEDATLSMESFWTSDWGQCADAGLGASDLRKIVQQCAQSRIALEGKLPQSRILGLFAVAYQMSVKRQNDYQQFAMESGMDVTSIDLLGQKMLEFEPQQSNASDIPCYYLFQNALVMAGQDLIRLKKPEDDPVKAYLAAWKVVEGAQAQCVCLCQKYDVVPPACSCP